MLNKWKWLAFAAAVVLYQLLFWQVGIGLNLALFSLYLVVAVNVLENRWQKWLKEPKSLVELSILMLSAATVWHAADWTIFVLILIWFLWLGYRYFPDWKSLHYAALQSLLAISYIPENIKTDITFKGKARKRKAIIRWITISIVPFAVFLIFFAIYFKASAAFRDFSNEFVRFFDSFFYDIFSKLNVWWIFFIAWGIFLAMWTFFGRNTFWLIKKEHAEQEEIKRTRKRLLVDRIISINTGLHQKLKDEFRAGLLLIFLVNALLFLVNILDLRLISHDYSSLSAAEISEMVHSGTYLLIFSIMLSIGILLFIFRSNQNFFPNKKYLQIAAYVWIAQSVVLTFSVAIRNYHYIQQFGLAYKRIGVIFFLMLVVFGLVSLWLKIRTKRSAFYMLRVNGWAMLFVVTFSALFNWDIIIAQYNINNSNTKNVDVDYILRMAPKVLPYINDNQQFLSNELYYYGSRGQLSTRQYFEQKKSRYVQENCSWQEWNYADYKAKQKLRSSTE